MAIEVKVLYATPTVDPLVWTQPYNVQVETSFPAVQAMPSTSVLAVAIFKTPPGTPRKLITRMYPQSKKSYQVDPADVLYGTDKIGVGHLVSGPNNWVFWDQWDDDDDQIFALDLNDLGAGRQSFTRPGRLPAGADTKVFTGAYVHPPDWAAALVIIDGTLKD